MKKSIFLFFAAILCAMTAKAYDQSAVDLYFDNSEAKWSSCYVYIGHSSWTSCYPLTRVSGTQYLWKLAKADFNGGQKWGGASGWVLCYEKWWDSKGESIDKYTWHGAKNVTKKRTSAWSASYIYKTNGTVSVTSDGNTINAYNTTTVSKKDYTVTINTVEGGTLTVKDYDNNVVATGASKIHLTVLKFSAAPASGYVLDAVEINDGTNTTTIAAADLATKTHTLTSNVTINPVWRATTSTVTVTATATNGTVAGGGVVEEGTSVTLTATPADGYKFVNWTVGGAEVSTANPYTFTAEADVEVVANFEELPKTTVYFINTNEWTNVKAYAYSPANASWPGVDATLEAEKIGGFDVYSYTVTEGKYANVIFNGSGGQTADLTWTDGKYYIHNYNSNTGWYTQVEAAGILVVPVEYEYVYLINTNDWTKAHIYTWNPEVATWPGAAMTKEAEQIAGKDVYSYKVVKGTTFGGLNFNCGSDACKTGDLTWKAGKYYAPSTNAWYDDAAAAAAALAAIEDVYSIKGVDALGLNWKETDTKDDMTKQGDGSYLLVKSNITLAAGNYEYKAIKNHSWDWKAINSGNNLTLHVDKSGRYNITFTLNAAATEVKYVLELLEEIEIIPDCYVSGNATLTGGAGWVGNEFKMTYDDVKKLHYYTFDLKKDKTYELKVVCSTWFGYDHLGAYYTEVTNKDGGIQVKLTADATVTVWFDYKTSKITFEGLTEKTFKDVTFTITATSTPKIYWWNAGDKLANADWNSRPEMTPTANPNEYTYTLKDVDESTGVEYLITIGSLQTANQKTKVDVVANFKDLLPLISIYGIVDWEAANAIHLTIADDYATATANIELAAETTYKFKVNIGGKWLGNKSTMNSDNCTGWTFAEKDGEEAMPNAGITTTIAGEYTFTWNVADNKLSVTYPTPLPTPEVIREDLTVGQWGTLCPKQNVANPTGATFYQIAYLEEKDDLPFNMHFYEVEGNLEAGQPYFFIASATEIKGIKSGKPKTEGSKVNGFYGYIGETSWTLPYQESFDVDNNNTFVIWNNSVFRINAETSIKSERCYININSTEPSRTSKSAPVGARRITMGISGVNGQNTATGVDQVQGDNVPTKMIINGQLFILRGEKMYDAQGKLVK